MGCSSFPAPSTNTAHHLVVPFPRGFEPENLKGFSYLLRGLVNNTELLGSDVLESFSMVDQNK